MPSSGHRPKKTRGSVLRRSGCCREQQQAAPTVPSDGATDQPTGPTTDSVPDAPTLPVPQRERVVRQPLPGMTFEGLPGVQ